MKVSAPPSGDAAVPPLSSSTGKGGGSTRAALYGLMALHVGGAAGTYVLGKAAAVGFDDPETLTFLRALGAALIFLALTGTVIPRPRFRLREWVQLGGLGLLVVPFNQYCFIRGLRYTEPSHPALLFALTPVVVLVLESLRARRWPPGPKLFGVALALGGVLLILRPWERSDAFDRLRTGDFWILGAVVSWSIYTIAARAVCRERDPLAVTAWSLIIGAAVMLPVAGGDLPALLLADIPARAWLSLAWLAVVTSVVMMLLWNVMLHDLSPVEVAICTNAQPPATVLLTACLAGLGWMDRQQDLGWLFFSGMMLVIAGVVLAQFRRA